MASITGSIGIGPYFWAWGRIHYDHSVLEQLRESIKQNVKLFQKLKKKVGFLLNGAVMFSCHWDTCLSCTCVLPSRLHHHLMRKEKHGPGHQQSFLPSDKTKRTYSAFWKSIEALSKENSNQMTDTFTFSGICSNTQHPEIEQHPHIDIQCSVHCPSFQKKAGRKCHPCP